MTVTACIKSFIQIGPALGAANNTNIFNVPIINFCSNRYTVGKHECRSIAQKVEIIVHNSNL